MHFASTRDPAVRTTLSGALRQGLAPDGGLFLPCEWPHLNVASFDATDDYGDRLNDTAIRMIAPFAAGDGLAAAIPDIVKEAFNLPAPCVPLTDDGRYSVLELFHGPTAAFKDFGARFLAACFSRLHRPAGRTINILVATSGDTGGAVAAAFHGRAGARVTLLFPKGLVSPTQERQLTCWGDNVVSCAVRGTFDECQRIVKEAFVDASLREQFELSSANSINIGRLLPQATYFGAISLASFVRHGEPLSFIIPSGNLGNAFACMVARTMGMPVGEIVLAHNANRTVVDFLATGEWTPRPSITTLASAMDVGNPSNMERFRALFPHLSQLRSAISAVSVNDAAICQRIRLDADRYGRVWCPHTATAAEAYARLPESSRVAQRWCVVATAHPAKFPEVVEPLIGRTLDVPDNLRALFSREVRVEEIDASLPSLRRVLEATG